jgi:hypothetical protein
MAMHNRSGWLGSLRAWATALPFLRPHRSGASRGVVWVVACLIALLHATDFGRADAGQPIARPRIVVLTDISNEPDDEMSLVRFLVYANEFEVEGRIATTSVWLRDNVRPDLIRKTVEAYGQVQPKLAQHTPGFPPAAFQPPMFAVMDLFANNDRDQSNPVILW